MIRVLLLLSLVSELVATCLAQIEPDPGFAIEKVLELEKIHAFTWDEHGSPWFVNETANGLQIQTTTNAQSGAFKTIHQLERRGRQSASLLVHAGAIYVSDGAAIRVFTSNAPKPERAFTPPANLFPNDSQITRLTWSPIGQIYFHYQSTNASETGIGRVSLNGDKWDVVAKGITGKINFDSHAFPILADIQSSRIFRVASGIDYEHGLVNYKKSDLAISVDQPNLQPTAMAIDGASNWLIFNTANSTLQQYREGASELRFSRDIARLNSQFNITDLQIGPDAAVWALVAPSKESKGVRSSIIRIENTQPASPKPARKDLAKSDNAQLAAEFSSANSWNRNTALRILDTRGDLRATRGLHPNTPLHETYRAETNPPVARLYAILSLHRLGLLDETMLENVAEEKHLPILRAWAALLFGERNLPTGTAFQKLIQLAKDKDPMVRAAAAIGARQFVSGSLAVDTPPAVHLREVWTGGILSTLWFSTEQGRSPEFDLLFWNAVRPITAYDPAHPMGFFNGDSDSKLTIAYWIIKLITRQIAETEDPLKQEDAMKMVGDLNPKNPPMIIAALEGLKSGSPERKAIPTDQSLEVLRKFQKSDDQKIAALSEQILKDWQKPFKQ